MTAKGVQAYLTPPHLLPKISPEQEAVLEKSFEEKRNPADFDVTIIAAEVGLQEDQVKTALTVEDVPNFNANPCERVNVTLKHQTVVTRRINTKPTSCTRGKHKVYHMNTDDKQLLWASYRVLEIHHSGLVSAQVGLLEKTARVTSQ